MQLCSSKDQEGPIVDLKYRSVGQWEESRIPSHEEHHFL